MKEAQLELFQETEQERLTREIAMLKKELHNIRRGLFARHTELAKEIVDLRKELKKESVLVEFPCERIS